MHMGDESVEEKLEEFVYTVTLQISLCVFGHTISHRQLVALTHIKYVVVVANNILLFF